MEETVSNTIRCIRKTDPEYPEKLRAYKGMPEQLYVKGHLPDSDKPSAAIVGARMCTPYGRAQAYRYAKYLSDAGVQVISGLAYGIDAESHKGALAGTMPTFAVLGNGVDICYPSINRKLYGQILESSGGIISEFSPGTEPRPLFFPMRNRIISALADVVLVVEAKEKSGSLITAQHALEQGKAVYAIPGCVNEELSRGCHKLIYDGAGIAYTPEILLEVWGIYEQNMTQRHEKVKLGLASDLKLVYSCLDLRPKNLDQIIQTTGLPAGKVNSLLMELEVRGLVREAGRHYYVRQNETEP